MGRRAAIVAVVAGTGILFSERFSWHKNLSNSRSPLQNVTPAMPTSTQDFHELPPQDHWSHMLKYIARSYSSKKLIEIYDSQTQQIISRLEGESIGYGHAVYWSPDDHS